MTAVGGAYVVYARIRELLRVRALHAAIRKRRDERECQVDVVREQFAQTDVSCDRARMWRK